MFIEQFILKKKGTPLFVHIKVSPIMVMLLSLWNQINNVFCGFGGSLSKSRKNSPVDAIRVVSSWTWSALQTGGMELERPGYLPGLEGLKNK